MAGSEPAFVAEEPHFEQVPYEELGDFSYEDYSSASDPSAQQAPAAQQQPATQQAPTQPAARQATAPSATQAQTTPPVAAFGEKRPDLDPQQPQDEAAANGESSRPQTPEDLPPDLVNILENAFEVFGSDVRVSKES